MRRLILIPLAAAAALALATAGAGSLAKERVIGQASASGLNATAIAEGDARKNPKALFVQVEATAGQAVQVDWYVVCNYPAFEVRDRKGSFTAQPPFEKRIPFPKRKPIKCGLSVSAGIAEGDVTLTLLAR